jgi:hypothetical protein
MGYSFWCSRCKFDHEGECKTIISINVDPTPERTKSLIESIQELVKALEAGGYNAKPTKLHQCRRDGRCGVPGCDPTIPDDAVPGTIIWDDVRVKGDSIEMSYRYKMRTPLTFIPITFQVA